MPAMLKTNHLKKYFKVNGGYLHAVDDISIEIPRQKTLGVVGESGCGKSTLGRTILQLIRPTSGEVIFNGKNIVNADKKTMQEVRRNMQIIFQDPFSSLDPRLSVYQLIAEPMKQHKLYREKKEVEDRVFELMETVGLTSRFVNLYPHELDGGRRQRIGIARALALNPEFIVCDEPVSALDVSIQAQILNLLMDIQERQSLTYMFITHNLAVVKHISNEIMVMYLGQCVEKAESEELFQNPLHPYTKALLASIPAPNLQSRKRKLQVMKGEISNPINPPRGCRFALRCPYCTPACSENDFPLKEVSFNHFVACNLFSDITNDQKDRSIT